MKGWRALRFSVILSAGFVAAGCAKHYRAPELPPNQLGTVTVDSRATLLSVDGLPPPPPPPSEPRSWGKTADGESPLMFSVGTGCRAFSAKYKESFFVGREEKAREGLGQVRTYETLKPIHFFVPVRAGYTYWVTATFTGDEFLPRVVEIEPSGESVAHFLPDVPCGGR